MNMELIVLGRLKKDLKCLMINLDFYMWENQQIEKMLMTDVPGAKDPQTGRPMNWFAYLSEHGGELSPAEKKLVESKFGED